MSESISNMNKGDLVDEILEESDEYDREDLENSSKFTNDDRKDILRDLREDGSSEETEDSDGDNRRLSGHEIAEKNGYPVVDGNPVVEILDSKETVDQFHCRFADGGTAHVDKDLFE